MSKTIKKIHNIPKIKSSAFFNIGIELENNILESTGEWSYHKGIVCITGFYDGKDIIQVIRETGDTNEVYANAVWTIYSKFITSGKVPVAFNYKMEYNSLNTLLSHITQKIPRILEVKPFSGAGWSINRFYYELIEKSLIKPIQDPVEGGAQQVIDLWRSEIKENQQLVIEHNRANLIKESLIQAYKKELIEGKNIQNGWIMQPEVRKVEMI